METFPCGPARIETIKLLDHSKIVNSGLMWIDGRWLAAASGETFERFSPVDGQLVGIYPRAAQRDVELAVNASRSAFDRGTWRFLPAEHRSRILLRAAHIIRERAEEIALRETLECGKVISQARAEMEWSANLWEYCAGACRSLTGQSFNNLGDELLAVTAREPIGVVSIVTPWNYPFLIISQKLPFALAAGCTAVVKPSEFTCGTTLILGEILEAAGLPPGVVNIITGYGKPAGQAMFDHPGTDMISFTGSTAVGRLAISASSQNIKKVSLELGGKNAQIVFPDANLDEAVAAVVKGAFSNAGQSCNCGSRLIVHRSIAREFSSLVISAAKRTIVANALDPTAEVGAIVNCAQSEKICRIVNEAISEGAIPHLKSGQIPSEGGHYVYPTILTEVKRHMKAANDEIFGPILSVITFDSEEEALSIANQTRYGLSASIWTCDFDRALRFSRLLQAGTVWVNTYLSGPAEIPFGGYKESGLGRENGIQGVEEFTEIKAIQFKTRGLAQMLN